MLPQEAEMCCLLNYSPEEEVELQLPQLMVSCGEGVLLGLHPWMRTLVGPFLDDMEHEMFAHVTALNPKTCFQR